MKILEYLKKNKDKLPDTKDSLIILGGLMTGKGLYTIHPSVMWILCGIYITYLGWPKGVTK